MTPDPVSETSKQGKGAPAVLGDAMTACRRALVTVGAFSFFINLLMLTVPVYMVQVFDRVMSSRSEDTLWVLTVAALMAFAVMAILDLIRSRILVRIGVWLDDRLGAVAFTAGLDASAASHGGSPQALRDLAHVRSFLTGSSVFPLLDAPWAPLFVAIVFMLHPMLGMIALIGAVLLFSMAFINELMTRAPLAAANTAHAGNMALAESLCRQRDAIEALGMIPTMSRWWSARSARSVEYQTLASDRAGLLMAASRFIRLALQIAILGFAAMLVIHDQLTMGAMIAASIMVARALAPVEQAVGMWRQLVNARTAFRRLKETIVNADHGRARTRLPRPEGKVTVERVSFVPPGANAPLFANLSLTVMPGEILGVAGASGAGKTTLARMLVGLAAPTGGRIRLDGMDVHAWASDDLGRHAGYVPQVVELLPGTVRENIARFTDVPPAPVIKAAKQAGVHEMIMRLPAGYDTPVGGPNDWLSAGARQRLGLARALFGDPRLLVLDEPYSNLDAAGADALMTALHHAKEQGATIIIVAHRPSILARADKILVVDPGGCRLIDRAAREQEKARLKVVRTSSQRTAGPETRPIKTRPIKTQPAETKPAETKPTEAKPPAAAAPAPRTRRQPSKRVAKGK